MDEFLHILTDPAHMAAEVVSHLVIEAVILGLIWPKVRGMVKREHRVIDAEHGVAHPEPIVPLRTVGWGPFRLPGERRRMEAAHQRAVEFMRIADDMERGDIERLRAAPPLAGGYCPCLTPPRPHYPEWHDNPES